MNRFKSKLIVLFTIAACFFLEAEPDEWQPYHTPSDDFLRWAEVNQQDRSGNNYFDPVLEVPIQVAAIMSELKLDSLRTLKTNSGGLFRVVCWQPTGVFEVAELSLSKRGILAFNRMSLKISTRDGWPLLASSVTTYYENALTVESLLNGKGVAESYFTESSAVQTEVQRSISHATVYVFERWNGKDEKVTLHCGPDQLLVDRTMLNSAGFSAKNLEEITNSFQSVDKLLKTHPSPRRAPK